MLSLYRKPAFDESGVGYAERKWPMIGAAEFLSGDGVASIIIAHEFGRRPELVEEVF